MSAEFTPGTTFAQGGTYTAGHFNDYVRAAVVIGIDRINVGFSANVLGTRDSIAPAAPTDKEIWIDSANSDLASQFFTGAYQGLYTDARRVVFNTGNGVAFAGGVVQSSSTNPVNGVPAVALTFASTTSVNNINHDLVGISYKTLEVQGGAPKIFMAMAGPINVRVTGVVTAGDWLRIVGPSPGLELAPNGTLIANNLNRDTGILLAHLPSPFRGYLLAQAIDFKTTSTVGTVLAKLFT